MTAPGASLQTNGAAEAIQKQAAEWITEQFEAGEWDDAHQAELDAWLAETPAHLLAYWRLKATWERTRRLAALQAPTIGSHRIAPVKNTKPRIARFFAASAVLLAATGWILLGKAPLPEAIYETPVGGHKIIELADGSRVELNTATKIKVRSHRRAVELVRGEAYFQIRHDNFNPFTVYAKGHRVVDLGTKFLMRADRKGLTVALLDGSIRFESDTPGIKSHSEVLVPGDVAVATSNSVSVTQRSPQLLADSAAWRNGMLVFRDETLKQAVAELNRYNREKIIVRGDRAANVKIDGTFHADNISGFTNMVERVLDLKVYRHGPEIVITD